ncbi:hypothetical protein [Enterococcus sp.]|uniref:hypothetical protein n=1 Tax=Enterococcus sp. TaxID=35783 RepID=UPI0028A23FF7|nr:hypothetical protein [Enterococcus sp.]
MKNARWQRLSRQKIQSEGNDGMFLQVFGGGLFFILSLCGRFIGWSYEKLKIYRLFQPRILMLIVGTLMIVNTIIDWSLNMNWEMDPTGAKYWTILEIIQIVSFVSLILCFYFPTKRKFILLLCSVGLLAITSVIRPILGNAVFTITQLLSFVVLYLWELGYLGEYFTIQPLKSIQLFAKLLEEEETEQLVFLNKQLDKLTDTKKVKKEDEETETARFARFYWLNESFILAFVMLLVVLLVLSLSLVSGNDKQGLFTSTNLFFVLFLSLLFYPYVLGLCSRVKPLFIFLKETSLSKIGHSFQDYKESNEKEILSYARNQKQVLKIYQETKSVRKNVKIGDRYQDIQFDIPVEKQRIENKTYYEKDNHRSLIKLVKFSGLTLFLFPVRLLIFYFSPVIFSIFFIVSMLANGSLSKEK